jgi:RNase P/RNase MRP subunit POP5
VVRLDSEEDIPRNLLIRAIRNAARSLGEQYYEDVGPWLTYFENNYGVIKYNHKKKEEMLTLVERIALLDSNRKPVPIHTLGISGTINKARKKYIP